MGASGSEDRAWCTPSKATLCVFLALFCVSAWQYTIGITGDSNVSEGLTSTSTRRPIWTSEDPTLTQDSKSNATSPMANHTISTSAPPTSSPTVSASRIAVKISKTSSPTTQPSMSQVPTSSPTAPAKKPEDHTPDAPSTGQTLISSFLHALGVAAADLEAITERGLILVGSSETRRIWGFIVAYYEALQWHDYYNLQKTAKYGEANGACTAGNSEEVGSYPGLVCTCGGPNVTGLTIPNACPVSFNYTRPKARVHFFWKADLKPDPQLLSIQGSEQLSLDRFSKVLDSYSSPVVFFAPPLSHVMYNPAFPHSFVRSIVPNVTQPSQIEPALYASVHAAISEIEALIPGNGRLLVGNGYPYCDMDADDMLWRANTSGSLLEYQIEHYAVPHKEATPKDSVCSTGLFEPGEEITRFDWSSPCDDWLQSNSGVARASKVVERAAESVGVTAVDTLRATLGTGRSGRQYWNPPPGVQRDDCYSTHWPFWVIADQLNAILKAARV